MPHTEGIEISEEELHGCSITTVQIQSEETAEPGTAGTNNINTEVLMNSVAKAVGVDCLLLVDSLTAKEPERMFQTIQLSTSGEVSPLLSGRKADWFTLGIPVISLGVPMATPVSTLCEASHKVDCWTAEIVLAMREKNSALKLHCVLLHEGQADKWSSSAQERHHSI